MSLVTRIAISSFDDVVGSVELNVPDAAVVQVAWSRSHQSCAVMGLFDDEGSPLEVKPDVLARLTGLIARPVPAEALSWAFPGADMSSGSVLLSVSVHEPVSLLFAERVREVVLAGSVVSDAVVRDAVWFLLDAMMLPAGAVSVRRMVMVPELVGDAVFEPVVLWERPDGSGRSVPWERAVEGVPVSAVAAVAALVNELAVRAQREASLRGPETVLTEATVSL